MAGKSLQDMKTLVVIVTYNGMRWIERCLMSVKDYDVFIVDNGSTDGTQDYIQSHFPQAAFWQSETNLGFGKANNLGLRHAVEQGYDYVYLMNQDAWVMPDTIRTLEEINTRHPEYGVLSPMQMADGLTRFESLFGRKVLSWEASPTLMEDLYFKRAKEVYSIPFVMAAHWLISIDCLKKVGGFSPAFPHYGEDDNYLDRVAFHGFKVGVACAVRAVHDRGGYDEWPKQKLMYINGYIIPLKELSSISSPSTPLPIILKNAFWHPMLFKSLRPLGYLCRLMREYPAIRRLRERSKQAGAFMTE